MKFKKILAGVLCFAMMGASVPIGQMDIISSYADADETAMTMTTVEAEASTEEVTWNYIPDTTGIGIEETSTEYSIVGTGSCGENLTYTLDSNGLLTISGTGEIYSYAFAESDNIKSVIIEDGVTSIGWCVFYDCSSLTSITIPDSVVSIGLEAFYGCTKLTDVYYSGTKSKWNNVKIDCDGNVYLGSATIHFSDNTAITRTFEHSNDGETVIEVAKVTIDENVATGGTVYVPVRIFNNPGFTETGFLFKYDSKLEYSDVSVALAIPESAESGSSVALCSTKALNITGDGILYALCFKLPSDAKAGNVYTITSEMSLLCDESGHNVPVQIYSGSITVTDDSGILTEPVTTVTENPSITTTTTTTVTENPSTTTTTTTSVTTTTDPVETKILGDPSGDGKIDSKDAVVVLQSYAKSIVGGTVEYNEYADINKDGKVDSKDAVIILKYYAASIVGNAGNIEDYV